MKENESVLETEVAKISCLGPVGTYSYLAAREIFSKTGTFIMAPTIKKVFDNVENEMVDFAVVPAENSIAGVVQETIDSLLDYPLNVVGSYIKEIHHCLAARVDDVLLIKQVKSHVQPLSQCKEWLSANLPEAILASESSSVEAIVSTTDPEVAFIADETTAKKHGLKILARNIQDYKDNYTEFYVLSKNEKNNLVKNLKQENTLMIIASRDRLGLLSDVLNVLTRRKLNLVKLHSRKRIDKGWDYYFFLEIESLPSDPNFIKAKKEIEEYCSLVRILGVV
ncbi:ACT domain-containing protein [Candidatus Parcubacteria bacterium]|nr:ACT domain-containing protein [Patescibacteria group bacterium]MBU4309827.1 ACT domain-containing protein [Patescibacteria group bacterium]MBU4432577.1 ACT domain-containing protein [Patescibacteria group bacterium]MBU4578166.1 ACT domain-containing protein [Patescibacteria group bacterium]MCG2696703.1 ACT domain-containing protein [Candidatus Parcubacteria bacterium]